MKKNILLIAIILIASCSTNSKEDLVGQYSFDYKKFQSQQTDFVIFKKGDQFYYSFSVGGDSYKMEDMKEEENISILGNDWKSYVITELRSEGFWVYKVKKGATSSNGHTFKTDYYCAILFGAGDAYKLSR